MDDDDRRTVNEADDENLTVDEAAAEIVIELSKLSAAQLNELADNIIAAIRAKE